MTPRLGLCVARVGFVIMVLCTAASAATQITYADGPAENNWADNILEMGMLPLFWVAVATEEETNFALIGILLVHVGGILGLTVMAVGLAMAGAGARVKDGSPRIGLCVAVVGFLMAVLCAVHSAMPDMGLRRLSDPFGNWNPDATMTCQALWLLGGFVGFNLVVVGLVTAGVLALTRQPDKPASSPGELTESPLSQLRQRTWPIRPRQGLFVALAGLVIIVLCVACLLVPEVGVLDVVPLYLAGFVGLFAIVARPRQRLYVAFVGLVIVLCVQARLYIPDDGYAGIFGVLALYLGVFVGLVVTVVGLVLATVRAFLGHLTAAVAPGRSGHMT